MNLQFNLFDNTKNYEALNINGIELVDKEKLFLFTNYMYFEEVKKDKNLEPILIKEGLDTYIHYCRPYKDVEYSFYGVIEGITGTYLSYSVYDSRDKNTVKQDAIDKAKSIVEKLDERGILEETILRIASNLTGVSPRYSGDIPDFKLEPINLKVGDKLSSISIRGGLRYSTYTVDEIDHNSVKMILDGTDRTFYHIPNELCISETTEHFSFVGDYKYLSNIVSVEEVCNYLNLNFDEELRESNLNADKSAKYIIFLTKQINLALHGQLEVLCKNLCGIYSRGRYNKALVAAFNHFTGINIPMPAESYDSNYTDSLKLALQEFRTKTVASSVEKAIGSNAIDSSEIKNNIKDTIAADVTGDSYTQITTSRWQDILKSKLTLSNASEKKFTEYKDVVSENSEKIKAAEIPHDIQNIDEVLINAKFIRTYMEYISKLNYRAVYFKPLNSIRRSLRVSIHNILTVNGEKIRHEVSISGDDFCNEVTLFIGDGDIENKILECMDIIKTIGSEKSTKDVPVDIPGNDVEVDCINSIQEQPSLSDLVPNSTIVSENIWELTPTDIVDDWYERYGIVDKKAKELKIQVKEIEEQAKGLKGKEKKETLALAKKIRTDIQFMYDLLDYKQQSLNEDIRELVEEKIKQLNPSISADDLDNLLDDFSYYLSDDPCYMEIYYKTKLEDIFNEMMEEFKKDDKENMGAAANENIVAVEEKKEEVKSFSITVIINSNINKKVRNTPMDGQLSFVF